MHAIPFEPWDIQTWNSVLHSPCGNQITASYSNKKMHRFRQYLLTGGLSDVCLQAKQRPGRVWSTERGTVLHQHAHEFRMHSETSFARGFELPRVGASLAGFSVFCLPASAD